MLGTRSSGVRWQAQRDTALFAEDNEPSEAASAGKTGAMPNLKTGN